MQRFGELFGLTAEDVDKVFGHPRVVLKRNLDRARADAYLGQLTGIGMAVSLDALHPPAARPLALEPQAAAEAPAAPQPEAISQGGGAGAATAIPAARAADERRELGFEFTGNGFEFFRIWIVNLLLGIVTLGIYSAWAKVRTQRYFYGNARLDGTSFEYLADPLKILKGRLIAFAMLVIYMLADQFVPLLGVVLMLFFFAIFPWIMVRGLAFRNHNSAWRGVRFGFDGRIGEAYKVFLLWPLLGLLTAGILFPYAMYRQQQFVIGNSRYGVEPFRFGGEASNFYLIALAVIGVGFGGGLLMGLVSVVLPLVGPFIMIATYLLIFALSTVMMTNLRFNNTTLGSHALQADYRLGTYALLMLTNTLAIGLTLGLFYPWAKVRTARYAAQHIGLAADGDLGEFAAAQRDEVSAVGGEIGDVFDVDLGI
ncbi:DUF898 domain-containing protein [Pseudothauera rhizosphaerae]|uniref:DUF898 domain-containing protein n=2 Tax=Pseudothauera rhizosphaerae TaxID=2565932 RepID=A0A4S4AUF5_9RHOO|nr:DUF898 domain-containing protein [Pseudothauera rhizosphaerae]